MSRYKFRGKRINNGEWVYGFLLINSEGSFIVCNSETSNEYGDGTDLYATEWYKVDPETVGQWTGQMDKSGKKIFEGDIVEFKKIRFEGPFGVQTLGRATVEWWNEKGGWSADGGMWFEGKKYEVVGNIYENPELLKGDENE